MVYWCQNSNGVCSDCFENYHTKLAYKDNVNHILILCRYCKSSLWNLIQTSEDTIYHTKIITFTSYGNVRLRSNLKLFYHHFLNFQSRFPNQNCASTSSLPHLKSYTEMVTVVSLEIFKSFETMYKVTGTTQFDILSRDSNEFRDEPSASHHY
jgi:hypothetical protein